MLVVRGGANEGGSYDITPFPGTLAGEQMPGGFKVLDASGQALASRWPHA
jgi:hypothetical protein